MIAYLFLVNILPVFIIPMMWAETGRFTEVLNSWTDFEVKGSLSFIFDTFRKCCICLRAGDLLQSVWKDIATAFGVQRNVGGYLFADI